MSTLTGPVHDSATADFPVIGIGASAGGIMALRTVFRAVPPATGAALVVVQHMLADQPSHLVGLISGWTSIPVRGVADGAPIERGCVFVAGPGQSVLLRHGVFVARPLDGGGARAGLSTIDSFFESLSIDFGRRAVAVVLSGTGADGAAGAVRVKQAGGLVFVQDPITAMHDGMPAAAIANGAADRVLPLGTLAQELADCASPSYVRNASTAWADDATRAFDGIIERIRVQSGLDLAGYKTTPLLWRIQRRMEARRVPRFDAYELLLQDDPAELETLIRGIPIHVTDFFRDAKAWDVLEREVVPALFQRGTPVRAWTPACSTGEEAYSVAMLFDEHAVALGRPADFQIFATDAAAEIVARAGRGMFTPAIAKPLSAERRHRFFYAVDSTLRVKRSLRERMVFAPQDVLADPPFRDLDLITCRNLLIYLDQEASRRVVRSLHSALRIGGYLFLGQGESLYSRERQGFVEVAPQTRIYQKLAHTEEIDLKIGKRPPRAPLTKSARGVVDAHAHEAALVRSGAAGVLVDDHFQILRVYGDIGPFVRFRSGEPNLDLLRLLPVPMELERAAQEVRTTARPVTVTGLVDPSTGALTLSLKVTPVPHDDAADPRMLVTFIRGPKQAASAASTRWARDAVAREVEAMDWSQVLRLTHEELEASREELQALNEELRASNDQLNIANDDLNQANSRLRGKIQELETQSHVLASGAVMALFLDETLRVRWFTPRVDALFPLSAKDIGRRITDLTPQFHQPDFLTDVDEVIRSGHPKEFSVASLDGRWFMERIRPFRTETAEGASAGVAITFTDITDRKRAEQLLQDNEHDLQRNQRWLAAQSDAFRSAMEGEPLAASLGILARAAVAQADMGCRCAFYIADRTGTGLHHVVGMPDSYAERVNRSLISPESLACGLALATGAPVITPDVLEEPRWERWTWLAREYDYRGCWSFPVETSSGTLVGSVAMYFREPRVPTARDRDLATALTQTAASIICRHQEQEASRSNATLDTKHGHDR